MEHIGQWINKILVSWGIKPSIANILDEIVITLLLIFITIGLNFISQTILIKNLKKLEQRIHIQWLSIFLKPKVTHYIIHGILALFVYLLSLLSHLQF